MGIHSGENVLPRQRYTTHSCERMQSVSTGHRYLLYYITVYRAYCINYALRNLFQLHLEHMTQQRSVDLNSYGKLR